MIMSTIETLISKQTKTKPVNEQEIHTEISITSYFILFWIVLCLYLHEVTNDLVGRM